MYQSQRQTQTTGIQEEEISMIRSTFYTQNTKRKLVSKPKDRVGKEDKTNIVYEIHWNNCEAV